MIKRKSVGRSLKKNIPVKTAILLLNDFLMEDFNAIVNNLEFKENLLIITNTIVDEKQREKYGIRFMFDNLCDVKDLLKRLRVLSSENNLDFCGIAGFDEEHKYVFSKAIADEFQLPYNSRKTLDTVSDKYLQASALKKGGVDVPDFRLVDTYLECKDFRMPCVIKPVRGISSIHVYRCDDYDGLKATFKKLENYKSDEGILSLAQSSSSSSPRNPVRRLSGNDAKSEEYSKSKRYHETKRFINETKRFIIEEFIEGNEYSCDFLAGKEVCLLRCVKKIVSKKYFPFFEGLYLFNPDDDKDSEFSNEDLKSVCERIAKSLDITTGICMVDFRFDKRKNRIVVIETTTRSGVDDFIGLMNTTYGYTSVNILLRQIFGTLDIDSLKKIPRGTSLILYLIAQGCGTLKKFDTSGLEKLRLNGSIKGVREIIKYNDVSDTLQYLGPLKNPPMIGHVIIDNIRLKDIESTLIKVRLNVDIRIV